MREINRMKVEFPAKSENESFARSVIAVFAVKADPNVSEIAEIKMIVSEAVTNCIIHGYENKEDGVITMESILYPDSIMIVIEDFGVGIQDIELAKKPLYTSKPEQERSGMGFPVMENFSDNLKVYSELNKGTKVIMLKQFQF